MYFYFIFKAYIRKEKEGITMSKDYRHCNNFTFKPKNSKDILRILKYLRGRSKGQAANVPRDIIEEAS